MNCNVDEKLTRATNLLISYQKRFRECQNLILGKESVLILVMKIEEPLDVLHQVVEHDTIQPGYKILNKEHLQYMLHKVYS